MTIFSLIHYNPKFGHVPNKENTSGFKYLPYILQSVNQLY